MHPLVKAVSWECPCAIPYHHSRERGRMTDEIIPEDVEQFILQHIDSIAQWEGLILMRADPAQEWNALSLARRLYIGETEAAELLSQLASQGFLSVGSASDAPLYRYAPRSPEFDPMIARVAGLYAQYLVPITHLIHSKPKSRIQKFADAFRIRKD